jgi:putative membrane protein
MGPEESALLATTRPSRTLLVYYVLRAWLFPILLLTLPYHYFRYHTMRYRFDREGVSMSWGVIFRREIHLAYARIQDIHLTSNPLQRWLGLANVEIQTASASARAEMTIEGLPAYEALRDFLYERMRGARATSSGRARDLSSAQDALQAALVAATTKLRGAREALEQLASSRQAEGPWRPAGQ